MLSGMESTDDGVEDGEEGYHGFKSLGTSPRSIRQTSVQWVLPNSQGTKTPFPLSGGFD